MPRRLPCWLTALLLPASMAWAQLPSAAELVAAVATSAPQARESGLAWSTRLLWVEALRQRSPLVAAHHRGVCHLGYSAYTPGQDFSWMFPALGPAHRAAWLAGAVQHELAHCAEQAAADDGDPAGDGSTRQQEVLADLAFALHLDRHGADGTTLVVLLAALRSRHAAADPSHDTADALLCYLQERASFQPPGDWLSRLRAWRQRCGAPRGDSPEPAARSVATAWVDGGSGQASPHLREAPRR